MQQHLKFRPSIDSSGNVINTVQSTYWTSPSGVVYTVPVGYDPANTLNRFNNLTEFNSIASAVIIANTYHAGGLNDLQRSFNGAGFGGFVNDYRAIASFDFGVGCRAIGFSQSVCVAGGGIYNLVAGFSNKKIDTSGDWFNNPQNPPNINNGSSYFDLNNPSINNQPSSLNNPIFEDKSYLYDSILFTDITADTLVANGSITSAEQNPSDVFGEINFDDWMASSIAEPAANSTAPTLTDGVDFAQFLSGFDFNDASFMSGDSFVDITDDNIGTAFGNFTGSTSTDLTASWFDSDLSASPIVYDFSGNDYFGSMANFDSSFAQTDFSNGNFGDTFFYQNTNQTDNLVSAMSAFDAPSSYSSYSSFSDTTYASSAQDSSFTSMFSSSFA